MNIRGYIEHTLLRADATSKEIGRLCMEAVNEGFVAVCVHPAWVKFCKTLVGNGKVRIATVIGFPLGANTSTIKVLEAKEAIENGADELDMVISIGRLKEGDDDYVGEEIRAVKETCQNKILKVIVETSLLNAMEKERILSIVCESGADYIKTSTGFSTGGASVEDVKLFRSIAGDRVKIKASGGIRDYDMAVRMIQAGADRIGTSQSLVIIKNEKK